MSKGELVGVLVSIFFIAASAFAQGAAPLPQEPGLAAKYPGDIGVEEDPAVVFVESFDEGSLAAMVGRWSSAKNQGGMAFSEDVPPGSPGGQSLQMTATRGKDEGAHLFHVFKPGYEQLYARFYVKFCEDHGYVHHFVKLQGAVDPPPYPMGGAGSRPKTSFTTGIEPARVDKNKYPGMEFPPPGIWHFYTYWPEMRSWETPEGLPNNPPDGTGRSFYGNYFGPIKHYVVPRDEWTCVEFTVKLNSDVAKSDGGQAFWINGELAGNFMPGAVAGYRMRDTFRNDATDERSKSFEGIRWRTDPRVEVNKLWLLYYMSEGAFKGTEEQAQKLNVPVNTQQNNVWFDHLVVAKEYIGPLAK